MTVFLHFRTLGLKVLAGEKGVSKLKSIYFNDLYINTHKIP